LLAFFASGNRSLLAAQAFVEVMLEAFSRGVGVDALEAGIRERSLQASVAQAKASAEEEEADGGGGGGGEAARPDKARRRPPPLLTPLDQDILLSWMLVTALAASELGIPFGGRPGATGAATGDGSGDKDTDQRLVSVRFSREALGLLQYVKTTLRSYFDEEYTLSRVTALQALTEEQQRKDGPAAADGAPAPGAPPAPETGGGGRSQFAELMQQYTRLVLIAADVASGLKLPTSRPLHPPSATLLGRVPTGFTGAFDFGALAEAEAVATANEEEKKGAGASSQQQQQQQQPSVRSLAVRLVVCFMGAVLGEGAFSTNAFAACALDAYARGIAAEELFSALEPEEFAQAGGLVRATGAAAAAATAAGGSASAAGALAAQEINARLFARWLSMAYFTAAQLGVPFPGAAERPAGWAWVSGEPVAAAAAKQAAAAGGGAAAREDQTSSPAPLDDGGNDAIEAAGLAGFVSQALALAAREERQAQPGSGESGGEGADLDAAPGGASPEPGSLAALLRRNNAQGDQEDNDPERLLERQRADVARELSERGTVRGKALPAMVRMPDPSMAATSAAVAAFRQQLGVVGAVRAVALAGPPAGGEEGRG
jgi:hypothetical protein